MSLRPLTVLVLVIGFTPVGCRRPEPHDNVPTTDSAKSAPLQPLADSLPLSVGREKLAQMIVQSQHKRVWGRLTAYDEIERIVRQVGPIIREAANQPEVQQSLRRMAADSGLSVSAMKERWIHLHEADILLESGGRDDAVSVANAVGVSQWMAGTAQRAGLRVDLAESNRLTAQLEILTKRAAELRDNPVGAAAPDDLAITLREIERLRSRRRLADQRYDLRPAIMAQARYLLGLYPKFPDGAWLLQAYHGGESGVSRTLSKYLGSAWRGNAAEAIQRGNRGSKLSFERLYVNTTPRGRPDAFSYLYGRSDDHRYYWWKVRSALEAFAHYRKDERGFRRRWESFLPGRAKEAYWYPQPSVKYDGDGLLPVVAGKTYVARTNGAVTQASKGALLLVGELYRRNGGGGKLLVGDALLPPSEAEKIREHAASRDAKRGRHVAVRNLGILPGGGPPVDFNFHTTGLAVDIKRPTDPRNGKILEYALGWLTDRHIIWWRPDDIDSAGAGRQHYHLVPNPLYRLPLERIARTGTLPRLPNL